MAIYDIYVHREDGTVFSLNTQAWNVYDMPGRRQLPEREQLSIKSGFMSSTTPLIGEFKPSQFSIKMWITPDMPDGRKASDPRAQFEKNLSEVLRHFARPDLFEISQLHPTGKWRWCKVRVLGTIMPELKPGQDYPMGTLTILLENPSTWWSQGAEFTQRSDVFNEVVELSEIDPDRVGVGPITDARVWVYGPVTDMHFADATGLRSIFQLPNVTIPADEWALLDCKTHTLHTSSSKVPFNITATANYWGAGHRFFELTAPYRIHVYAENVGAGAEWGITAEPKVF